jgi:hypothetical protein
MMTPFRLVFLLLAGLAVAGTSYVAYMGYGSESTDLDRSVRVVGAGRGLNGHVK